MKQIRRKAREGFRLHEVVQEARMSAMNAEETSNFKEDD